MPTLPSRPAPVDPPTEASVRDALRAVIDPEVGEPIVELGLIERVEVTPHRVDVTLIATSATCPMTDVLLDDVIRTVGEACPADTTIDARIDWDIAWSPERMTPALRARFGWTGA